MPFAFLSKLQIQMLQSISASDRWHLLRTADDPDHHALPLEVRIQFKLER